MASAWRSCPCSPSPYRKTEPSEAGDLQAAAQGLFHAMFWFLLCYLFTNLLFFLAALGLRCCAQAFSSCSERGLLFVAVCRLQ